MAEVPLPAPNLVDGIAFPVLIVLSGLVSASLRGHSALSEHKHRRVSTFLLRSRLLVVVFLLLVVSMCACRL
jgi:hypothetical protein